MPEAASPSRSAVLRLTLACQFGEVRRAARAVCEFLRERGCGAEQLMDCQLALVEACNNAINYAGKSASGDPIVVEANCGPEDIELRIIDHTPGFEWPAQVKLPDSETEHGRGLFLIQSVMDHADYVRAPGGNTLVLRKKRRATE